MTKSKVFTVALNVAFLFSLASSVRADPVHLPPGLEKFRVVDVQALDLSEIRKADIRGLLSEHFANNNGNHFGFANSIGRLVSLVDNSNNGNHFGFAKSNGKHFGFSVAAVPPGMKFTLPNSSPSSSVTESPEPTGMLLLGTGLAAGAAFLRRRTRNRRRAKES